MPLLYVPYKKLLVLILGPLFTLNTWCVCSKSPPESDNVDYSSQVGPIKNQDTIGWCYAYTSADLLNQYLYLKKGPNHANLDDTVSPISLALLYNQHKSSDLFKCDDSLFTRSTPDKKQKHFVEEGGTGCETLKIALSQNVCLENKMRSADYSYVSGINCSTDRKCTLENLLDQLSDNAKGQFTCSDLSAVLLLIPKILPESAWEILQSSNRNNILNNLRAINCDFKINQNPPPVPKSLTFDFTKSLYNENLGRFILERNNEILFNQMDAKLKEGKVLSISYFPQFLQNENFKHKKDATLKSENSETEDDTHASTIVGKRFNQNTCEVEYILKNSWGQGCGSYMKDNSVEKLGCIAKANGQMYIDETPEECKMRIADPIELDKKECQKYVIYHSDIIKAKTNCENKYKSVMANPRLHCEGPGYVFIPKSELAKNMFGINYLDY